MIEPNEDEFETEDETLPEELDSLDAQSRIFLEMREQNLELLRIAAEVAGFSGNRSPLKSSDVSQALRVIWEIYSEFYSWIDPEEAEETEEGEED